MKKLLILFIISCCSYMMPQTNSMLYLEGSKVYGIEKEGSDIWVATYGNGIYKYSATEDKWVNFSSKNKVIDNDFFYCVETSKNYVWAGSADGLFIYDKRKNVWSKKKFALGGEWGQWIRALCYDEKLDVLWIGRFKYLSKLDVSKGVYSDIDRTMNNNPKTNCFTVIKLDGDSLLWCGTEAGIHILNKKKAATDEGAWQFLSSKSGAFNGKGEETSVTDIIFDGPYVWFATDEFVTPEKPKFNTGGIYRYNRRNKWDEITKANGLPANGIYGFVRVGNLVWSSVYKFDKNDKKEFGKGLVVINKVTGKVFNADPSTIGLGTSTIYRMFFDGANVWFGTNLGLYKYKLASPLSTWSLKKEEVKVKQKLPPKKKKTK